MDFYQNRLSNVGCRADTDTQTHRQTHSRQTHRQLDTQTHKVNQVKVKYDAK